MAGCRQRRRIPVLDEDCRELDLPVERPKTRCSSAHRQARLIMLFDPGGETADVPVVMLDPRGAFDEGSGATRARLTAALLQPPTMRSCWKRCSRLRTDSSE